MDCGAHRRRLRQFGYRDITAEDIGHQLDEHQIGLGQPTRENDTLDRDISVNKQVDDGASAKAKQIEKGAIYFDRRGLQIHAEDQSAQSGICKRDARSVPPVESQEAVRSGLQRAGGGIVAVEALAFFPARKCAHEPCKHITESRLPAS